MRLDKFLKESRIIKRRTAAKSICEQGYVSVNGKKGKAGTEIKPDDVLEIQTSKGVMKIKVISTQTNVSKKHASTMYENII